MQPLSTAELTQIRRLMEGGTFEKDRAEARLRECCPTTLPSDILDTWTEGSSFDQFRAGRIREAWSEVTAKEV